MECQKGEKWKWKDDPTSCKIEHIKVFYTQKTPYKNSKKEIFSVHLRMIYQINYIMHVNSIHARS